MSSYVMSFLEIPSDQKPDWPAARERMRNLPEDAVADALDAAGVDPDEDEGSVELRNRLYEALDIVSDIWEGRCCCGGSTNLTHTDLLYGGGSDADDSAMLEVDAINLFDACGAAKAAGFLERKCHPV